MMADCLKVSKDTENVVSLLVIFTARCTIVQSTVLRSHVVCLSVCPSVCDVGDQDHIG